MKQSQALKLKEQGNQAYKNKDYQHALKLYSQALNINPHDPNLYSNKALCYFNLQNYLQCINNCDRAIQLNPAFIKAYRKKAATYAYLLKFSQAVATIKTAIYQQQGNQVLKNELQDYESYESNYNRYIQAERKQDYSEALSCVSYLLNKFPTNKVLKLYKIQSLAKTGATDEALTLLKNIPYSVDPDISYLKGIIQLYSGDSLKAKKYFTQGLQLDPEHQKCKQSLNKAKKCEKLKEQGNQLLKANKFLQSQAKYTQALNLDPYNKKLNSIIYSNRALTFMKRKKNLKALDDLNKSLSLNPKYLKSLVRRAQINMQRQEYSAAIMDYSKIQQLDPSTNFKDKINQAKKKQKLAKKKDYYKILQINKTATDQEIKKIIKDQQNYIILIEIEINLMHNNKKHQKNLNKQQKLMEYYLIKIKEKNMIVDKCNMMVIKVHNFMI